MSPKSQPNLEFLDASYNHLVTLEGLRVLGQLKELNVSWNKLTKAREDVAVLRKHTPTLLKLDTRYNPWNRVCGRIKENQITARHNEEASGKLLSLFPAENSQIDHTGLSNDSYAPGRCYGN